MGNNMLLIRPEEADAHVARVTIDMLPDVALIETFDFYVRTWKGREKWYTLARVCRRWRNVVFGSPLRLDLRLYCKAGTPVRQTLNVWPLLPIEVWENGHEKWGVDNIVAALEHNDRICQLSLFNTSSFQLENVLAAMQQPFPALTALHLEYRYTGPSPVVPASFLGGSAPPLEILRLCRIPFPGLPKLLLSATHLVFLVLWDIPHSGYISPETMVTCLSVLTGLKSLYIGFESPQSRPNRKTRRPPPRIRTLLPVLTELRFKGVVEYLEELVTWIDAPLVGLLAILFFHRLILETPQLTQFISRTPKLKANDEAHVIFSKDRGVRVTHPQTFDGVLRLGVSCRELDWQLSSLAQLCSSSLPQGLIHGVQHLYIFEASYAQWDWQDDVESNQWLEVVVSRWKANKKIWDDVER